MLKGAIRGLQEMADYLKFLIFIAEKHPELWPQVWPDLKAVADAWLAETVTLAGVVKISAWTLIGNGDPWQGSRQVWKTVQLKWSAVK